jgi:hypothetical protein
MWIKQDEDERLPEWLGKHLSSTCRFCGSPMLNYYNPEDNRCTGRKCSNENCPGMIAARADNMRQIIGIKGIGFAACLESVKYHNITNPVQLLKYWNIKPRVDIGTYLRMQCWEGVDSALETEMLKYNIKNLDDLFNRYDGKYRATIEKHKDELYALQDLVELPENKKSFEPKKVHTIMITGTPVGWATKEAFIAAVNDACQGIIVTIHQKTKRQSGVDYLICESGSTTTGKVETALKAGIPIVTSAQYVAILDHELDELSTS